MAVANYKVVQFWSNVPVALHSAASVVTLANQLKTICVSASGERVPHKDYYLRDFFSYVWASTCGETYNGDKLPAAEIDEVTGATIFLENARSVYATCAARTEALTCAVATKKARGLIEEAILDFCPAFQMQPCEVRQCLRVDPISWMDEGKFHSFYLDELIDGITALHSGIAPECNDATTIDEHDTLLKTKLLLKEHRSLRLTKALRISFVAFTGGFTAAPFFRKMLEGLLHGFIRSMEKIMRLNLLSTVAETGSVKVTVQAAKDAGINIRVGQHHMYSAPHLHANIKGGSSGGGLLKCAPGADKLVAPVVAVGKILKARLMKYLYILPTFMYRCACDPDPKVPLGMSTQEEVNEFLDRVCLHIRLIAMALYNGKLTSVPSFLLLTCTLPAHMRRSNWATVSRGLEAIIEAMVQRFKAATVSCTNRPDKSFALRQAFDHMWSTLLSADESDAEMKRMVTEAEKSRKERRTDIEAMFLNVKDILAELDPAYDWRFAKDLTELIACARSKAHKNDHLLLTQADLPLKLGMKIQHLYAVDEPGDKYYKHWLTATVMKVNISKGKAKSKRAPSAVCSLRYDVDCCFYCELAVEG
jgi:hypothetical protein